MTAMETMTEPRLRVLILGTGAREHALARKLSNEPKVERIIILPGNAGIRDKARKISSTLEVVKINPENGFRELIAWAKDMRIDLVIPGHQRWKFPMLGEDFSKAGIQWFGPSLNAAALGRCPIKTKGFMEQFRIPTPGWEVYTDYESLKPLLSSMPSNLEHEKIDGPAETPLGHIMNIEGSPRRALIMTVLAETPSGERFPFRCCIPATRQEAHEYAKSVLSPKDGEPTTTSLMIEHNPQGTRINMITFSDGRKTISLPPVEIFNEHPEFGNICDDRGCVAPIQGISPELVKEINDTILQPTIEGLLSIDVPYVGVLSTDIMLTIEGPKALRYETYLNSAAAQALLPLLPREANLIDIIQACMNGRLEDLSINLEMKTSVMVSILAAQLDRLDISRPVEIPHRLAQGHHVFYEQSVTALKDPERPNKFGGLGTFPGPVMGVCVVGNTIEEARNNVYDLVKQIGLEGKSYNPRIDSW